MAEHLNRLDRSLAALRIAQPFDREGWVNLIEQLLARTNLETCIVYLQVTRGVARRDHQFPATPVTPTVFGMISPWAPPSAAQRTHGLTAISIPDERWLHCEIKSVSLLGNVLAKQQAVDADADEVVQFRDDYLTEGSSTNIWVVSGGKLLAPPKNNLILEGIRAPHHAGRGGIRRRTDAVVGHQGSAADRGAGRQTGGIRQARPRVRAIACGL
ncbi:hypothetical protein G6F22_018010 [Rhizopus arrhizus]|nr:hypothetical protein G6F22_018010 [Rhizopus arrhizus]